MRSFQMSLMLLLLALSGYGAVLTSDGHVQTPIGQPQPCDGPLVEQTVAPAEHPMQTRSIPLPELHKAPPKSMRAAKDVTQKQSNAPQSDLDHLNGGLPPLHLE